MSTPRLPVENYNLSTKYKFASLQIVTCSRKTPRIDPDFQVFPYPVRSRLLEQSTDGGRTNWNAGSQPPPSPWGLNYHYNQNPSCLSNNKRASLVHLAVSRQTAAFSSAQPRRPQPPQGQPEHRQSHRTGVAPIRGLSKEQGSPSQR
jgi:hypothetical protein